MRSRSLTPWIKGGSWRIEPEGDDRGLPLFRGVSVPDRPWTWYDPMQDTAAAYLDCARIGESLLQDPHHERANGVERQFLDFVNKYGPLYVPQLSQVTTSAEGWPIVPAGGLSFRLYDATDHAKWLAWAVKCYQGVMNPKQLDSTFAAAWGYNRIDDLIALLFQASPFTLGAPHYDPHTDLVQVDALETYLYAVINHVAIKGASPAIYLIERDSWESAWQYDSLASAMWLQLHQTMISGAFIHRCQGCGVLFKGRPNQLYCDPKCRGRANSRRRYQTKRGVRQ